MTFVLDCGNAQRSKMQTRTFVHVTAGHRAYSTCGKCLNLMSTKRLLTTMMTEWLYIRQNMQCTKVLISV